MDNWLIVVEADFSDLHCSRIYQGILKLDFLLLQP